MKRLFILVCMLVAMLSSVAEAYSGDEQSQSFMPCITGTWVDENGHRQIVIGDTTPDGINDARVQQISDWKGDAKDGSVIVRIMEKQGNREMKIQYHRDGANSWLLLDDTLKMVPKVADKVHSESIGGVTLDMSYMELLNLYGAPNMYLDADATEKLCGVHAYSFYYKNDGWLATFDPKTNTVDRIFLFAGSDKHLDKTVLDCDASLDRFQGLYGFANVPAKGDNVDLGNHEYLSFAGYPDYLCLSIYP